MNKLYPFKSNFININGIKYHYIDEGQGEPIVMLHGNPTWSFYYRNLITGLRDSYRTIVPDHIGCGLSDKPSIKEYSYTLERRVEDVEYLLNHLNIKKDITLIVHDWGGMIGMGYAVRHPESIKRLVILNTSGFRLPKTKPFPPALGICRDSFLGEFLVRGLNAFVLSASYVCVKRKPLSPEVKKSYISPYNSWDNRIAVYRFVKDIPLQKGDPSYDFVKNVEDNLHLFKDTPILICWGEKDFVFDIHFLKGWKERFPHAEVHSYPDYGHYILEDAGEEILSFINSFLIRK